MKAKAELCKQSLHMHVFKSEIKQRLRKILKIASRVMSDLFYVKVGDKQARTGRVTHRRVVFHNLTKSIYFTVDCTALFLNAHILLQWEKLHTYMILLSTKQISKTEIKID